MQCAQFIFKPGTYDTEFHELDEAIAVFARSLPGFVGNETWLSADGERRNAIYYFEDEASLKELARFDLHRVAKKKNQKWYDGHVVVVSEVSHHYGDGRIPHVLRDRAESA
ncbi:MAG TPA: hypothetical protein VK139_04690 [Microbacteriaceae bacterium]|nr:hypothetical protein [Microbacteriaceae bacterium]